MSSKHSRRRVLAGGAALAVSIALPRAEAAAQGEEIVIAKAGKPKAKLVPYEAPRKKRVFGQNLLGITYMADDWDGPLPPEIQKYFGGESDPEDPLCES